MGRTRRNREGVSGLVGARAAASSASPCVRVGGASRYLGVPPGWASPGLGYLQVADRVVQYTSAPSLPLLSSLFPLSPSITHTSIPFSRVVVGVSSADVTVVVVVVVVVEGRRSSRSICRRRKKAYLPLGFVKVGSSHRPSRSPLPTSSPPGGRFIRRATDGIGFHHGGRLLGGTKLERIGEQHLCSRAASARCWSGLLAASSTVAPREPAWEQGASRSSGPDAVRISSKSGEAPPVRRPVTMAHSP